MRLQVADSLIFERRLRMNREQFMSLDLSESLGDRRLELVNGAVVVMPIPSPRRAQVMERLNELFVPALVGRARVLVQLPLALDDQTQLAPALAVVDRRTPKGDHPRSAHLVVEVAESAARYERIVKTPLYAKAGVEACWLLNAEKRSAELLSEPRNGEYTKRTRRSTGPLQVPGFPELELGTEDLFP